MITIIKTITENMVTYAIDLTTIKKLRIIILKYLLFINTIIYCCFLLNKTAVKRVSFYATVCTSGEIAMNPYLAQFQLLPFGLGELISISYNYVATSLVQTNQMWRSDANFVGHILDVECDI